MSLCKKKKNLQKVYTNYSEEYKTNKYFRTFLMSFYAVTRNKNVIDGQSEFEALEQDDNFINQLIDEYISYYLGKPIFVNSGQTEVSTLKIPEKSSFSNQSILDSIKKAKQNSQ